MRIEYSVLWMFELQGTHWLCLSNYLLIPVYDGYITPWGDFPWSIPPQLEYYRRRQSGHWKHLAASFTNTSRSVLVPYWLSSHRAWKTAHGVVTCVDTYIFYDSSNANATRSCVVNCIK